MSALLGSICIHSHIEQYKIDIDIAGSGMSPTLRAVWHFEQRGKVTTTSVSFDHF